MHFGKAIKVVDPGLHYVNQWTGALELVDITLMITDIPHQQVMTKDNVQIGIDSVVYWHVIDPFAAKFQVRDIRQSLVERTMTTLRHVIGAQELQKVIANRESLAQEIKHIIEEAVEAWGIRVESILIKDLRFSQELQESLASVARQQRIGDSLIIAARAELEAAKLQRQAADVLNTPAAQQIRYLDTLTTMAKNGGTKIIFMPMSMTSEQLSKSTGIQMVDQA